MGEGREAVQHPDARWTPAVPRDRGTSSAARCPDGQSCRRSLLEALRTSSPASSPAHNTPVCASASRPPSGATSSVDHEQHPCSTPPHVQYPLHCLVWSLRAVRVGPARTPDCSRVHDGGGRPSRIPSGPTSLVPVYVALRPGRTFMDRPPAGEAVSQRAPRRAPGEGTRQTDRVPSAKRSPSMLRAVHADAVNSVDVRVEPGRRAGVCDVATAAGRLVPVER